MHVQNLCTQGNLMSLLQNKNINSILPHLKNVYLASLKVVSLTIQFTYVTCQEFLVQDLQADAAQGHPSVANVFRLSLNLIDYGHCWVLSLDQQRNQQSYKQTNQHYDQQRFGQSRNQQMLINQGTSKG